MLSQDVNYDGVGSFLTFINESRTEYNNPDDAKITTDLSGLYNAMNEKATQRNQQNNLHGVRPSQ